MRGADKSHLHFVLRRHRPPLSYNTDYTQRFKPLIQITVSILTGKSNRNAGSAQARRLTSPPFEHGPAYTVDTLRRKDQNPRMPPAEPIEHLKE